MSASFVPINSASFLGSVGRNATCKQSLPFVAAADPGRADLGPGQEAGLQGRQGQKGQNRCLPRTTVRVVLLLSAPTGCVFGLGGYLTADVHSSFLDTSPGSKVKSGEPARSNRFHGGFWRRKDTRRVLFFLGSWCSYLLPEALAAIASQNCLLKSQGSSHQGAVAVKTVERDPILVGESTTHVWLPILVVGLNRIWRLGHFWVSP